MKCECCNTNEAIVHLAVARGEAEDEIVRFHYCVECAGAEGLLWPGVKFNDFKGGNKAEQWERFIEGKLADLSRRKGRKDPAKSQHTNCDACRSKSHCRVGEDVSGAPVKSQGSSMESQKPPAKPSKIDELPRILLGLEMLLKKAIVIENYEEAAKIRDKISELKKEPPKQAVTVDQALSAQPPPKQAPPKPEPPPLRYGTDLGPVDGMQADGSVTKPTKPRNPRKPTK